MEQRLVDNKIQMIEKDVDGSYAIDYMEKVEGGHYYYNDKTESSDLNATREYEKKFVTLADTHGDDEFEDTKNGPLDLMEPFAELYDSFNYDEAKGCYTVEIVEDGQTISAVAYLIDGKLVNLTYSIGQYTYNVEMSYDNVSITLPTVA
jgi:hypothetical protein